jgi:serine/threonine protein kinase
VAIKVLTSHATELDQQGIIQEVEFTSAITDFIKNANHKTAYCTRYTSHFTHQDEASTMVPNDLPNHLCLVLELCMSDVDRMRRLSGGVIPSGAVKKVLRDILHGLCQLHALNCVHTGEGFAGISFDNGADYHRPKVGQFSLSFP